MWTCSFWHRLKTENEALVTIIDTKKTPKLSTVKESEIAATPVQTKNVLIKPNSTELKTAPLKKKRKIKATRRKLYKENTDGKVVADMINILSSVLHILNRVMF